MMTRPIGVERLDSTFKLEDAIISDSPRDFSLLDSFMFKISTDLVRTLLILMHEFCYMLISSKVWTVIDKF